MYSQRRWAALHEAGHLMVCEVFGLSAYATVQDDGSGKVSHVNPEAVRGLSDQDKATFVIAGEVAEALVSGADLRQAVEACFTSGSNDLEGLALAVGSDRAAALDAAIQAAAIIRADQDRFFDLAARLEADGIARVGRAPKPTAARSTQYGNLPAGPLTRAVALGGHVATAAELRGLMAKALADDKKRLANELKASLDRLEGRGAPMVQFTTAPR